MTPPLFFGGWCGCCCCCCCCCCSVLILVLVILLLELILVVLAATAADYSILQLIPASIFAAVRVEKESSVLSASKSSPLKQYQNFQENGVYSFSSGGIHASIGWCHCYYILVVFFQPACGMIHEWTLVVVNQNNQILLLELYPWLPLFINFNCKL